jgi:alginate O-acetyltransferase complex protein AlgI
VTFDALAILVFCLAAILYAGLLPGRWRGWFVLVGSIVAVYWLQPPLPIRFSDYILPSATIGLTILAWWVTRRQGDPEQQAFLAEDRRSVLLVVGLVVGLSFMRYVDAEFRITASRPPSPLAVAAVILFATALALILLRLGRSLMGGDRRGLLTGFILVAVAIFVVLKWPSPAETLARWWRGLTGQDTTLASPIDLTWLGFSFVAFRLIHTMRDRQTGILPALSLREYLSYVLFFASYTAGPIDRAERFSADYRALPEMRGWEAGRWGQGLWRIAQGLFKKFVIADLLAQGLSLTAGHVPQADSSLGLWLLLYGYALRLFFDFAGYTDIAIGIGMLFGIRLPENFNRPYLKNNITAFWQSWHATLSNWARFYIFTPLSRWLLKRSWRPPAVIIVLVAQLATMIVIGLWHGITLNYLVWGVWHGIALFVHKQWSDRTRKWYRGLQARPNRRRAWHFAGWFLTFNYVTLGWVWFALPSVDLSLQAFGKLLGIGV